MNNNSAVSHIKRSQKESLLLKELSKMLHRLSLDDKGLDGLIISRVELSRDKGVCFIFLYDAGGQEVYRQKLSVLILYKPTMRKALSSILKSRYVPHLQFLFDETYEKRQRIEHIMNEVKKEFDE